MTDADLVALRTQLQIEEGTRLMPYADRGGKITIGTGRNLTDRGITIDESDLMLTNDILAAAQGLARRLPWFVALDSVRRIALVDLAFNMGLTGLCGFHVMLDALKQGDWPGAAAALLESAWATQVQPSRRDRIVAMLRTGQSA